MQSFNKTISILVLASAFLTINSCKREKQAGDVAPEIMFKSGGVYTSADATVHPGDELTIGIEAEVQEAKDPIVKFNISRSINGANYEEVFTESVSTDSYEYDYVFNVDGAPGDSQKYTFTVTNRDGLTGQASLVLTIE